MNNTEESILPSKKIVGVGIIALAAIVAVFLVSRPQKLLQPQNHSSQNTASTNAATEDSDNDGLKDWEESLWRTAAGNPDTDGDGTEDGAEIEQNRNPIKPYPDDALPKNAASHSISAAAEGEGANEPLSSTAAVSREIFAQVIALQQSGGEFDREAVRSIAEPISEYLLDNTSIKHYSVLDINIIPDDTPGALERYGEAMNKIIIENTPAGAETELVIYNRAVTQRKPAELLKLAVYETAYQNIITEGLKLETPREVSLLHRDLLTSFSAAKAGVAMMQKVFTDASLGLSGISAYADGFELRRKTSDAFKAYFDTQGVVINGVIE